RRGSRRGPRGRRRALHRAAATVGPAPRDPAEPPRERLRGRRPQRSRDDDAHTGLVGAARRRRRRRPRASRSLHRRQRARPVAVPPHRRPVRRRARADAALLRRHPRDPGVLRGGAVMIKVLLVDDHELLRAGLRSRLENEVSITPVGEAETAEQAVVMARALQPDVILLDLLLPRTSGYEAIPQLAKVAPDARILVISSQAAPSSVRRALSAGAAGYLPKHVS